MSPKSPYWKYFEKLGKSTARCRYCSKIIKTCENTTNLTLHVTKIHPDLLKERESYAVIPKKVARISLSKNVAKQADTIIDQDAYINAGVDGHVNSFQPTLPSSVSNIFDFSDHNAPKSVRIYNAILYMMCKDSQPMHLVKNEDLFNLMRVCVPLYKMPSRLYFKRMVEQKYNICINFYKKEIEKSKSICITWDIWTETFADWGISSNKVFAIVTDAGANIKKAVELSFGNKKHIMCFAHMLNLVGQKAIERTDNLSKLISSVKKIVTWFKHSVIASDDLRKGTDLKLIQEVSTR